MILDLAAESVAEARIAAHVGSHCPILPFREAGANVLRVGLSDDPYNLRTNDFAGAVPNVAVPFGTIDLNHLGIVNVRAEGVFNSLQIRFVAVDRELNAIAQT
jgi:hypothetical protein